MAIRFHRVGLVASGKAQEAAAFAAEISKYSTEALGIPTVWGLQVGGAYGSMHWFSDHADMAAFEAAMFKTLTDPGYLAILAKAEDMFLEGSVEDSIVYLM